MQSFPSVCNIGTKVDGSNMLFDLFWEFIKVLEMSSWKVSPYSDQVLRLEMVSFATDLVAAVGVGERGEDTNC